MQRYFKAFTLMEVLVVVIIISVVLGFGVPSYYKQHERGLEKNANAQLKTIQRAQKMHKTRIGTYYPDNVTPVTDIGQLNDNLNININFAAFSYECNDGGDGDPETYQCLATRNVTGGYVLTITESSGPTCASGASVDCP